MNESGGRIDRPAHSICLIRWLIVAFRNVMSALRFLGERALCRSVLPFWLTDQTSLRSMALIASMDSASVRQLSIKQQNCHELIDQGMILNLLHPPCIAVTIQLFRLIVWHGRQAGKSSLRSPRTSPPRLRHGVPIPRSQSRYCPAVSQSRAPRRGNRKPDLADGRRSERGDRAIYRAA